MAEGFLPKAMRIWSYYYYDTPEGEDCFKKMLYTTKYATVIGGVIAMHDIILYKQMLFQSNLLPMFSRAMYWVGPYAAMGITFSAVPCVLKNIRNKDDNWNSAIGGFCAGMVMGGLRRSNGVGAFYGITLSILSLCWKLSEVYDWREDARKYENQFGNPRKEYGTYDHWKRDWTFTKDPKDRI